MMREVASYSDSTSLKLVHNFMDSVTRRIQQDIEKKERPKKILQKWNSNENTIMFKIININFNGHWKIKEISTKYSFSIITGNTINSENFKGSDTIFRFNLNSSSVYQQF